jgi:hypothetical protein
MIEDLILRLNLVPRLFKALLTGTGYIPINSTTKENIEMIYSVV